MLLCCIISATGAEATEQPQPRRPRTVGLGGEIISKYSFNDTVLSHCRKIQYNVAMSYKDLYCMYIATDL